MNHEHSAFAPLIGDWSVRMSVRSPDGTTTSSDQVHASKRWFGDGRYVREDLSGTFDGTPHEKLTVLGFNATRARYEYATADNHDAVVLLYLSQAGAYSDGAHDDRRFELFSDYLMPDENGATPRLVTIRTLITVVDRTHHELRTYYRPPGGDEVPFLEYVYRRRDGG